MTLVYECDGVETKFMRAIRKDGVGEYRIDGEPHALAPALPPPIRTPCYPHPHLPPRLHPSPPPLAPTPRPHPSAPASPPARQGCQVGGVLGPAQGARRAHAGEGEG